MIRVISTVVFLICALAHTPVLANFSTPDYKGQFCSTCTSKSKAFQRAKIYAPQRNCYPVNSSTPMTPDNMQCTSANKQVFLVHPISGITYGFWVTHEDFIPYDVKVTAFSLTNTQKEVFAEAASFYEEVKQVLLSTSGHNVSRLGFSNTRNQTQQVEQSCPTDSALATLLDPSKMMDLETFALAEITTGLGNGIDIHKRIYQGARFTSGSVSLSHRGASASVAISEGEQPLVYVKTFNESEEASSFGDVLAINIDHIGWDANNVPLLGMKLSKAHSRIAGGKRIETLLQALHGPQEINNECVLFQLKKLSQLGDFKLKDGSAARFGNPRGTPPGAGDSGKVTGCTIYFYNSRDELQYIFKVPKSQC
jgi:hypothetical protein